MPRVKSTKLMSKKTAVIAAVAAVIGLPLAVFAAKPLTQGSLIESPASSSDVQTPDVLNSFIDDGSLPINDGTANNEDVDGQEGTETNDNSVELNINGTQISVPGSGNVHQTIPPSSHNSSTIDVTINSGSSSNANIDIDIDGWNDSSFEDNGPLRERTEPHR
jgi:hypothetical protein